jgi:hypothetical protein
MASGGARPAGRSGRYPPLPATPGLAGSDIQSGDVGMLERAQQIAPLPRGVAAPPVGRPPRRQQVQQAPMRPGASIPPHLLTMQSPNSDPTTAGLDVGAGPGSEVLRSSGTTDLREKVLLQLWQGFGNQEALQMLEKMRQEQEQAPTPTPGPGQPPTLPSPT